MRIVSLLPSITEIVSALGKQHQLVGRSHECDYPESVHNLPVCSEPKFKPDGTSYDIDQRVKALLQEGLSIYRVDEEKLAALNPDIILTQDHCEVCAASFTDVQEAVKSVLGNQVRIISVSPTDLSSVIDSIRIIAKAIDAGEVAEKLMQDMKSRMESIQQKIASLRRPDVMCIEWLDPTMSAGNWIPELVQLAGGNPVAATAGQHSPWLKWNQLLSANPDIITIAPCGYSIQQTLNEIHILTEQKKWPQLRAVKNKQVFILDGNQYFNRPGPRLVDSTQILAEVIHPSVSRNSKSQPGWVNLFEHQFVQALG